jgi:hypothetical protein
MFGILDQSLKSAISPYTGMKGPYAENYEQASYHSPSPATTATADGGRPASDFNLTAEERAMLPDPSK